jgi:hypothetical protein
MVLGLLLLSAQSGFAATQPQTVTVCLLNPVPPGWLVISYSWIDACKAPATGPRDGKNINAYTMMPIPAVIQPPSDAPDAWRYDVVPGAAAGLMLFRSSGLKTQLCKVSVAPPSPVFACADVPTMNVPLADILKK